MFGMVMNEKDSQGMLEDVAAIHSAAAAANRSEGSRTLVQTMEKAGRALDQRNAMISELQLKVLSMKKEAGEVVRERDSTLAELNEILASGCSARDTIDFLVNELAKVTGEPVRKIRERACAVRTQAYEREIESSLQDGSLTVDPRSDGTAQSREWYRPDLL